MGSLKKLVFFTLFSFAIFLPEVLAGVGIGMGPTRINLNTFIGKPYSVTIITYNPGDYDIKARLMFECRNCSYDARFLGLKIGEIREDYTQFFRFDPTEVYVPNKTGPDAAIPITVYITPNAFIKKDLVLFTPESINFLVRLVNPDYNGELVIPYPTLIVDNKILKGGITLSAFWSTFGAMGAVPAVGSDFQMNIKGVPLGSVIIIIVLVIIVIATLMFRRTISKKFKPKKKK